MQVLTQSVLLAVSSYAVYKLIRAFYVVFVAPMFSHLRDLPGPKRTSLMYGNMGDIMKADPGELHAKWITQYGNAMKYKVSFVCQSHRYNNLASTLERLRIIWH